MTRVSVGIGDGETDLIYVETELEEGWWVYAVYLLVDGEPTLAELRVFPEDGRDEDEEAHDFGEWSQSLSGLASTTAPLTSRLLRDLSLIALKNAAKPGLEQMNLGEGRFKTIADSFVTSESKPGRKGRSDDHYLPIAIRYADLIAQGDRSPVETLASQLKLRPAQARDLIHEARVRGLLTKGQRGRAGGVLTEKALEIVNKGGRRGKR